MNFRKGIPVAVVLVATFLLYPKYPQFVMWILGLVLIALLVNSWDAITKLINK